MVIDVCHGSDSGGTRLWLRCLQREQPLEKDVTFAPGVTGGRVGAMAACVFLGWTRVTMVVMMVVVMAVMMVIVAGAQRSADGSAGATD